MDYICPFPGKKQHMRKALLCLLLLQQTVFGQLRQMPAYPLITHSTYFSVWSFGDTLNSRATTHWTGKPQPMLGILTVDGRAYRFLGMDSAAETVPAAQQWVNVNATQTKYQYTCGGVDLTLTFTSPLLLNDLALLSRPVTYISFRMRSNDGATHTARLSFGVSDLLTVDKPGQPVATEKGSAGPLSFIKAGS